MRSIGGVGCYVADDSGALKDSATPCLVVAPDVFGPSTHACLLADEMNARSGCPVVLIDCFDGTALPPAVMAPLLAFTMPTPPGTPPTSLLGKVWSFWSFWYWFACALPTVATFAWQHILPKGKAAKLPLVESVAAELQGGGSASGEVEPRNLGLIGYCYGGDAAMHFNTLGSSRFAATAVAHGTVTLPQVRALQRPALFICAENDFAFPDARVLEAEALVQARAASQPHMVTSLVDLPGPPHCYVVWGFTMVTTITI